mmetsp:Transcript_302/g.331  ORF Transcript_302/g.331 Transcript_302/m.331 type:complete len:178 (-) Transcript_302:955-1488(-)
MVDKKEFKIQCTMPEGIAPQEVADWIILDGEKIKQVHPFVVDFEIKKLDNSGDVSDYILSTGERATHTAVVTDKMRIMGLFSLTYRVTSLILVDFPAETDKYEATCVAEAKTLFNVRTRAQWRMKSDEAGKLEIYETFSILYTPFFMPASWILKEGGSAHHEMLEKVRDILASKSKT